MKVPQKSYLTPLAHTVSVVLQNPLNALSLVMLLIGAILLCLLDFKCALFILPIIVLETVSVAVVRHRAKHQSGRFGLAFFKTSAVLCLVLSLAFLGFVILGNTEYKLPLPAMFDTTFVDSPLPLSLLNVGFDGVLWFALSLAISFVSRLIFGCTLYNNLKTNTPKKSAFIISATLNALSFVLFTICALDRFGVTSLLVTAKGLGAVVSYTCSAAFIFGSVFSGLMLALDIYTFIKMRKNSYAF